MARKVYEEENIRAIADKIREKTGGDSTYKTSEMAEGVSEVYEAGKQAEYDRFWDNYQQNGNRTDYFNGFGKCWTVETFKPKYDIRPTDAYMMFHFIELGGIDLAEYLNNLGVTLDFSNSTNMQYAFQGAKICRVGVIDITKAVYTDKLFNGCSLLHTIDTLVVSENSKAINFFSGCKSLANINIEGIIAQDANFKDCPLTHDSLMSIINALKNFVETKTLTYSSGIESVGWELGDYRSQSFSVTNATYNNNTLTLDCFSDYCGAGNFTVTLNIKNFDEDVSIIKEISFPFVDDTFSDWEVKLTLVCATESRTLTLGETNLAKLSDKEKAIASNKGWILV